MLCAVIARPDQGLATPLGHGELGVHLRDGTELVFPLAIERDALEKAVVTLLIDQPSLLASTPKDLLALIQKPKLDNDWLVKQHVNFSIAEETTVEKRAAIFLASDLQRSDSLQSY